MAKSMPERQCASYAAAYYNHINIHDLKRDTEMFNDLGLEWKHAANCNTLSRQKGAECAQAEQKKIDHISSYVLRKSNSTIMYNSLRKLLAVLISGASPVLADTWSDPQGRTGY